ncbi:hypothetical protein BC835DRAFT_1360949 [Cytidiella melzeri]|nr:hypothetical protein BC835DRAFT_1360949 [Cytidiella melzeri]
MTPEETTENWDDDFEFQPVRSPPIGTTVTPLSKVSSNTLSFHRWAEAGSTDHSRPRCADVETWDDDFQDHSASLARRRENDDSPTASRRSKGLQSTHVQEPENWDDDFEEERQIPPSLKSARWDSSDEDDDELGFADREEDRTVTSRSRRGPFASPLPNESPPPPVPPIPSMFMTGRREPAPFPRSPTASVFSVPVSGRESTAAYSSTAHLALRPTQSGSSVGMVPPSPPIHHSRERRRLRKKSRPAQVEANIYELEDIPPRPVTPENNAPIQAGTCLDDLPPQPTPLSTGKFSLVSRIGSVGKKWGATRKKRASMGPPEFMAAEENTHQARPQSVAISSSPPVSKGTWFFRHGGTAEAGSGSPPDHQTSTLPLKHEKSVDRLLALVGLEAPGSPSRRVQKIRRDSPSDLTSRDYSPTPFHGSPRRPTSMQFSSSSRSSSRPRGMRHASYGQTSGRQTPRSRSSSVAHSASASVDSVSLRRLSQGAQNEEFKTSQKGRTSSEQDSGSRSFMEDMRRLSSRGHGSIKQTESTSVENCDSERPSTSTTATAVPMLPLDFCNDATPRPPSRVLARPPLDKSLLPPIELQPPSPRKMSSLATSYSEPSPGIDSLLAPLPSSSTTPNASTQSTLAKPLSSPQQSASLGRSTHPPKEKEDLSAVLRRNSLGDLKIPARISQAQIGLRRDLGMVREFATSVEQLKDLQATYHALVLEVQAFLLESVPPNKTKARATSPTFFGLHRPGRTRSSTNPQTTSSTPAIHGQLATTYRTIQVKFALSWECAELLVELGGGPSAGQQPLSLEQSASTITPSTILHSEVRKSRERAVTLAGDESKPQIAIQGISPLPHPNASSSQPHWRASTGRHDLSHRQLLLLRDMLNNADTSLSMMVDERISDEALNRNWRWGDAMSSTVTLPSEESSHHESVLGSTDAQVTVLKKRKSTRLGMRGLRDMLKSLRNTHSQPQADPPPVPIMSSLLPLSSLTSPSSTSVAATTESSLNLPNEFVHRRRAKTSVGPESGRSVRDSHPNNPYVTSASVAHRSSPRRPSLASIFRLGQRSSKFAASKAHPSAGSGHELSDYGAGSNSSCHVSTDAHTEEEDWDKVESSSELAIASRRASSPPNATVKSRSPYSTDSPALVPTVPGKATPNASRSSVWESSVQTPSRLPQSSSSANISQSYSRSTKLSDVKELVEREGEDLRQHRRSLSKAKRRSSRVPSPSPKRPVSRSGRKSVGTGSLRSPPPPTLSSPSYSYLAELDNPGFLESPLSLAMTPENIRPLLENAKEVNARCHECIAELEQLLALRSRLPTLH